MKSFWLVLLLCGAAGAQMEPLAETASPERGANNCCVSLPGARKKGPAAEDAACREPAVVCQVRIHETVEPFYIAMRIDGPLEKAALSIDISTSPAAVPLQRFRDLRTGPFPTHLLWLEDQNLDGYKDMTVVLFAGTDVSRNHYWIYNEAKRRFDYKLLEMDHEKGVFKEIGKR